MIVWSRMHHRLAYPENERVWQVTVEKNVRV